MLRAGDRAEPVRSGGKHAAEEEVADLRRRGVDHADQEPLSASFSIARPPVPVAWKTRQS